MRRISAIWLSVLTVALLVSVFAATCRAEVTTGPVIWLEAEQFENTGTWSNDPQFVDLMGSPYLLATGLGTPVEDASTTVKIKTSGEYRLWVRCKDWLPDFSPGRFNVQVAGQASPVLFGKADNDKWHWTDGGTFELKAGEIEIRLQDTTGWWGRCDAVVLAHPAFKPANGPQTLAEQRAAHAANAALKEMDQYDVVVVGGGLAGCGAAVAAARNGCTVAFIQDRPILGGNSSSEIQVPVMGHCFWWPFDKYDPGITGIIEEFYPKIGQTARSAQIEAIVRREKNISLFLNTRATGVEMKSANSIESVIASDVHTGKRMRFTAPLFIDCTGHGWIGYYAGAEYRMGQEARSEFNESLAPVKPGKRTMGNNLYNAEFRTHDEPVHFESPIWAYTWTKPEEFEGLDSNKRVEEVYRPENFDRPSRGKGRQPDPEDPNGATYHKWWVEYGGMLDTIYDAENIRDELFRITLGLWNYAKNHNPNTRSRNKNRQMVWLNYVTGVRESRRLIGDYIMTQAEYDKLTTHDDTVAFTDWGIDLHHPEGFWVRGHDNIHVYGNDRAAIPFRCLYSKNIDNLLMAGRCISVTHVALGGTRIMRTVCMTGQAAGTAAAIARRHNTTPRGVYKNHLQQLKQLMLKDGCFLPGTRNNDSDDLALNARATASSLIEKMEPEKVNDGWNRVVAQDRSAWGPDPNAPLPQWIELDLEKKSTVNTIHVTFEKADRYELDFALEAWTAGSWKTAAKILNNNSRRRVINIDPVETDKVRIVATKAPHGFAVCEVRLYNEPNKSTNQSQRLGRVKDLTFGMFVCWSFSTFSNVEWTRGVKDVDWFNPTGCDTDQWCRVADQADMKYILFLTKHHDGFCLWDTDTTNWKVTKSPLGIDVLAKLKKSCDKYGLKLALYFSEGDWTQPKRKNAELKKAQLKELLTRYGPIEYIWFDHAQKDGGLDHEKTVEFCKGLQPDCFIGFNSGDQTGADIRLGEWGKPGPLSDVASGDILAKRGSRIEKAKYQLAEFTYPIFPRNPKARWFYTMPEWDDRCLPAEDIYKDYLGARQFGNLFALDVGPMRNGKLRPIDVETLQKVGKYIRGEIQLKTDTFDVEKNNLTKAKDGKHAMKEISGGSFQMGDSMDHGYADERPVHTVTLDSFRIDKHEVTNAQYCSYLDSAMAQGLIIVTDGTVYQAGSAKSYPYCDTFPSSPESRITLSSGSFSVRPKGPRNMSNDPVVLVSWYGAAAYCNWLSRQQGRQPCYNLSTWACDSSADGYRLPTEAQWEYAARGGLSGKRFPWGNTISHTHANYYSADKYKYDKSPTRKYHPAWNDWLHPNNTSAAGSFPANGYGLHDMTGNVWEWCSDWYGSYNSDSQTNPMGPKSSTHRVLRGGGWSSLAGVCRVTVRVPRTPATRYSTLGFRIVNNTN